MQRITGDLDMQLLAKVVNVKEYYLHEVDHEIRKRKTAGYQHHRQ